MKYSEEDLNNIIALCEQDEPTKHTQSLVKRCEKALAYRDCTIKLNWRDKRYLQSLYDEDMDKSAKKTIEHILNISINGQRGTEKSRHMIAGV